MLDFFYSLSKQGTKVFFFFLGGEGVWVRRQKGQRQSFDGV